MKNVVMCLVFISKVMRKQLHLRGEGYIKIWNYLIPSIIYNAMLHFELDLILYIETNNNRIP